ncbi:MAG: hypothetical protein ACR2J5_03165 [Geodermatophilaceae bacterium]
MTTLLSPPAVFGLAQAREVVQAGGELPLWSLTDTQLAAEVGQAFGTAGAGRRTPARAPG